MQLPMIGNGISVHKLTKILNDLNQDDIIAVDLRKNLVVLDKNDLYNSDTYIDLYSEEVKSYKGGI